MTVEQKICQIEEAITKVQNKCAVLRRLNDKKGDLTAAKQSLMLACRQLGRLGFKELTPYEESLFQSAAEWITENLNNQPE